MTRRKEPHKERDQSYELVGRAPNPEIAGLWVSMLEAAGIAAFYPGRFLWARRILGDKHVDVFVPKSRLADAQRLINESRSI